MFAHTCWSLRSNNTYGELSERFMVTVLKTVVRQRTGGSNPSLSAAPPADRLNCKSTKVKLRQQLLSLIPKDLIMRGSHRVVIPLFFELHAGKVAVVVKSAHEFYYAVTVRASSPPVPML